MTFSSEFHMLIRAEVKQERQKGKKEREKERTQKLSLFGLSLWYSIKCLMKHFIVQY